MLYFFRILTVTAFLILSFFQNIAFSVKEGEESLLVKAVLRHKTAFVAVPKRLEIGSGRKPFSLIPINQELSRVVRAYKDPSYDHHQRNFFSIAGIFLTVNPEGLTEMMEVPFCDTSGNTRVFSSGSYGGRGVVSIKGRAIDTYIHDHMRPLFDGAVLVEEEKMDMPDLQEYLSKVCKSDGLLDRVREFSRKVDSLYEDLWIKEAIEETEKEISVKRKVLSKEKKRVKQLKKKKKEFPKDKSLQAEIDNIEKNKKKVQDEYQQLYKDKEEYLRLTGSITKMHVEIESLDIKRIDSVENTANSFGYVVEKLPQFKDRLREGERERIDKLVEEADLFMEQFVTLKRKAFLHSEAAAQLYLLENIEAFKYFIRTQIHDQGKQALSFTLFGHTWLKMCAVCMNTASSSLNSSYTGSFIRQIEEFLRLNQKVSPLVQTVVTYGTKTSVRCAPTMGDMSFPVDFIPSRLEETAIFQDQTGGYRPVYQVYKPVGTGTVHDPRVTRIPVNLELVEGKVSEGTAVAVVEEEVSGDNGDNNHPLEVEDSEK